LSAGIAHAGTELSVDLGDTEVPATVTTLPFIDNRDKVWTGLR
jgi:hypothetical protein